MSADISALRLAASWLLWYPDHDLLDKLPEIVELAESVDPALGTPFLTFIHHLEGNSLRELQEHYVKTFDMKRRACPYLTFWTDGETRNRGKAMVAFTEAYKQVGFEFDKPELADHLAVVLEFTAVGDTPTGEALLADHHDAIGLLRSSLEGYGSPYVHLLDGILATMPEMTPAIKARIAEIAANGPPTEMVGLEPFAQTLESLGGRR